ncbi:MAG: hypothetical protein IBX60_03495 [Candidatus Aminicenantes bacterium]|nr:hypothetical protein [Candidatus Aminicenantes bacterium]
MYPLRLINLTKLIKRFNPDFSCFTILQHMKKGWKKLKEIEDHAFSLVKEGINIGIVGEVYSCLEPAVNLNIEKKLKEFEANVFNTLSISTFPDTRI